MANLLEKKPKKIEEFNMDFDKLEEIMDKLMQQMAPDLLESEKQAIFGFSMRLGNDGKPIMEEFGNVSKQGKRVEIAKIREPLVDVQLAQKNIFVTVELPGVEKEDVRLNIPDGNTLEIIVAGTNSFYKKIVLPATVKKEHSQAKFKNGILEISLERQQPVKSESEIRID